MASSCKPPCLPPSTNSSRACNYRINIFWTLPSAARIMWTLDSSRTMKRNHGESRFFADIDLPILDAALKFLLLKILYKKKDG